MIGSYRLSRLLPLPGLTRFTRRGFLRLAAALMILGLVAPHLWAWYHLRAARAALAAYHPEKARPSLDRCASVWKWRPSVRLLAARAAWQDGDIESAVIRLREAQRLFGGGTEETAFEWALLNAAAGNVSEVEEYLQKKANQSPEVTGPLVWEALSVGYLRVYRSLDAMACLNFWLRREPENVRALELRGQTYVVGKGVVRGSEDFRRVLELDPTRSATRRRLVDALLSLGVYDEAAAHLERLGAVEAQDPGLASRLARCYILLGRRDEAARLLEATLARHPHDGLALRTRGQLALTDPRSPDPRAAEADLRRAASILPDDYQTHNLLFQALQQQGRVEEARAQLKVAEEVRDRTERIGELSSRKLAEFPLDPALHYEMGKLLLQTGQTEVGLQWLNTALRLDPGHGPSHLALAEYYESAGNTAQAEYHRRSAGTATARPD